jgi:hypothetical protein
VRDEYVVGLTHGSDSPSSVHVKLTPTSKLVKTKVASVSFVQDAGGDDLRLGESGRRSSGERTAKDKADKR